MIQEFEGKSKRTFYVQLHFSENRAVFWYSMVQCGAGQATGSNMTRYMCFACCITNAADTHSQYVICSSHSRHCWKFCHALEMLQCSNNCVSLFNFLTVDWDCWNCHLLMCSLACRLNMKHLWNIVRKYTPDLFYLFCSVNVHVRYRML